MITLLYKPVAIVAGIIGGLLSGLIFNRVWKVVGRGSDPPAPTVHPSSPASRPTTAKLKPTPIQPSDAARRSRSSAPRPTAPGTRQGIGFGGTSPTLVPRDLRLTGNVDRVRAQLSSCAARAGWPVHPFTTGIAGFWARKRFEDRWDAILSVYVGDHVFSQQPAVEIRIQTDPV